MLTYFNVKKKKNRKHIILILSTAAAPLFTLTFSAFLFKASFSLKKSSLPWLASWHRPEQELLTMFMNQFCGVFLLKAFTVETCMHFSKHTVIILLY